MTGGFTPRKPVRHTILDRLLLFFAPHRFEYEQMRSERNTVRCQNERLADENQEVHEQAITLQAKVNQLTNAIEKHRAATGHEMCWENDEELWAILKDGVVIDHITPPFDEFMYRCKLYRLSKDKK